MGGNMTVRIIKEMFVGIGVGAGIGVVRARLTTFANFDPLGVASWQAFFLGLLGSVVRAGAQGGIQAVIAFRRSHVDIEIPDFPNQPMPPPVDLYEPPRRPPE